MENIDKLNRLGIKTISQFGERYRDFLDSLEEKVFGEYVGYKLNLSQNELIYIQEKSMKTIKLYDYSEFPMSGTWAIVKDSSIHYEKGGSIEENENALMVSNNNKQIAHHTKELEEALKNNEHVPAWVVAKVNRSASDLSDATHYLDGTSKMETGGKIKNQYEDMSPFQIWSSWNYNQRLHFLEDHIHLSSKDKTYYADLDYSDLTETIQDVIHVHTKSGQYAKGGGVKIMPQQGTLLTKDKKLKLDYKKVGNNYEFVVYEGENNPVANYTKTSFKKKQNGIVTMDYNQFINYLYSEGYIDDKNYALGGSTPSQRKKVAKVMHEWKEGELHSGSKKGPIVKKQKQAVAIALSEAGLSKKENGGNVENNWRLPTKEEFKYILYPNQDKIPNLKNDRYWSSSNYMGKSYSFNFFNGATFLDYQGINQYVIIIRNITNKTKNLTNSIIVENLEIMNKDLSQMNWDDAIKLVENFNKKGGQMMGWKHKNK